MRIGTLEGGRALPVVVEPAGQDRAPGQLTDWLAGRKEWMEKALGETGAILFRGFDVREPAHFEQVARAVDADLKNNYLGTSPRDALTEYVFSASELPPYYPIPEHIEMSFIADPPRRLFFSCLIAPSGGGGETPIVDFRAVYRDLDPAVREKFESRGVKNIRNYSGPEGGSRWDLWKLKRWDEMFRTEDRPTVEQACRENGFDFQWKSGGRLQLTNVQAATRKHPVTGDPVWFNHSQVFHLSAAPAEYRRVARRQGKLRYSLLQRVAQAMVLFKRLSVPTQDQAMHCTYGDGSPISEGDMEAVRDAIWRNLVFFDWRKGDVLAIDNRAVAHGRMPYQGPRKIAVCWA